MDVISYVLFLICMCVCACVCVFVCVMLCNLYDCAAYVLLIQPHRCQNSINMIRYNLLLRLNPCIYQSVKYTVLRNKRPHQTQYPAVFLFSLAPVADAVSFSAAGPRGENVWHSAAPASSRTGESLRRDLAGMF